MNFESISIITGIIKRENNTSSLIYTLKLRGYELETTSLKHSDCMYSLMKLLSAFGVNMELKEPILLDLNDEGIVSQCYEDISFYLKQINKEQHDNKLKPLLIYFAEIKIKILQLLHASTRQLNTLTLQELAKYNGKDGQPAYVAVDGIVYDVTSSPSWSDAVHFGSTAGRELTSEFMGCHSENKEVLSKFPVVARVVRG